ncbi:uncharacterized protein CMC5_020570 [Chondromyces crocatus]|uniref:Uncharacterized protein n=1 Tax=Chondromyces crocatus TaxID=52 RepID=A0A0K1EAM8_CHOCO|nr:uncharacterized protein CMC5_020570 [Chondromyces crocatus]
MQGAHAALGDIGLVVPAVVEVLMRAREDRMRPSMVLRARWRWGQDQAASTFWIGPPLGSTGVMVPPVSVTVAAL